TPRTQPCARGWGSSTTWSCWYSRSPRWMPVAATSRKARFMGGIFGTGCSSCGRSPELPPGLVLGAKAALEQGGLRIAGTQHALGVVAQLGHAQGVVGAHQDVERLLGRRHVLVVGNGALGAVHGRHVGA